MQEYIEAKRLAQSMRGKYGRSTQEMITYLEACVEYTDCQQYGCTDRITQTRVCKCGMIIDHEEHAKCVPCEDCGGHKSTITWSCANRMAHKQIETSTLANQLQAAALDMDADEEAREAKE